MSTRARLTVLLTSVPIIAFILVGGYLGRAGAREDTYRHLRIFEDVVSLISNNYVEEVELETVIQGALRGLSDGLDADSAYLLEEDVERIETGRPLPDGRIGVELTRQFYVKIVAPEDQSPATRAGLLAGDLIRAIDNQPTRSMSALEATRLLRGEPGSAVMLSLLRGNTSEPYEIKLIRERLERASVSARPLSPGEAYIRVASFGEGVTQEIAAAIAQLTSQGATRLVIDVRNTAGGSHDEGIAAARLFVGSGTILRRAEQGRQDEDATPIETTTGTDAIDTPVILLTNAGTADAAELFTASLVSSERAETVGQRTAGRVSLQKLVRLPDGTGLWLSWARYLKASGDPLHRYGVEPTLAIDLRTVELGEPLPDDDVPLERAIERLRSTQL
jgi:carboxyl-terminal processing protease